MNVRVCEVPEERTDRGMDYKKFLEALDFGDYPFLIGEYPDFTERKGWKLVISGCLKYKPEVYFETIGEHRDWPNFTQAIIIKDGKIIKNLGLNPQKKYHIYTKENIRERFLPINTPEYVGGFSPNFGGAECCQIKNPYSFKEQNLSRLGRLYNYSKEVGGCDYWLSMEYLEEYFSRFNLKGKTVVHAEGNFQGRPGCNSWNTGLGERKETVLDAIWKLEELAYVGCRILEIKD